MSAAKAAKAALTADLAVVFPDSHVCYGHPGTYLPDEIVSVQNVLADVERGPMSTQRTKTETLTIGVTISVWTGGSTASQQRVTERAYDMLADLDAYLTDVGTANSAKLTLGHSVWQARIVRHELAESDPESTDPSGTPLINLGRWADITVEIEARARI